MLLEFMKKHEKKWDLVSIKTRLVQIIDDSIKKNNIDYETSQIIVEIPKNEQNGDYSTNIALLLAKKLKENPLNIAQKIANEINSPLIETNTVAPPGFINFVINKKELSKIINIIIQSDKKYGSNNTGQGQKINIEYVSANPTGSLHIGHGRGAVYGDDLSRILSFSGYDVTREYYINDAGNQMDNLGISIKERYKELCGLECNLPEDGYHGKEIISISEELYQEYRDKLLDKDIDYFKTIGLEILLKAIKKDLDELRVNFDIFTSEQSLYDSNQVEMVLNELKHQDKCYINEDALWLKTTDYGDEKDRVLVKNDGNYTYLLPDIAYHINKIDRGYDKLIDVLGSDHHGYIHRLKAALEILGKDSNILDIKILQMVRLLKDGEEIKVSKRTGKTITLKDLIEEIGINATRYFFSSKSLDTQMDFDIGLALKNSNENPVYYIEYANARICSILNKYHESFNIEEYHTFNEEIEYNIMNKLMKFEDVVITAADKKEPHLICNYVYDLAATFHSYYGNHKIITEDKTYTEERIALLKAIKIVINNSLNLIGVIPREEM